MPPVVVPAAAVAAATQDPVLQWFYEQYDDTMLASHRKRALELLYYDAALEARSPQGRLPLGKAYHYQGKLVSSRSSWDPDSAISVAYGKAGREAYHGHADWGQLCIDGYGERLVVDLGSPPGYPKGHHERYYNYQQLGHNVFVFGENETGGVSLRERGRNGAFEWTGFDPERGAAWTIDLTGVYDGAARVSRTVVHLLPRVVAVLDSAHLDAPRPISMRWHLAEAAEPNEDGAFVMKGAKATLSGRTMRVDGDAPLSANRHAYQPPYDTHRLGAKLKQRNEPYIELKATDDRCMIVSLFAVFGPEDEPAVWKDAPDGWSIETPEGKVHVKRKEDCLVVHDARGNVWNAPTRVEPEGEPKS
jgi:hypothetical protein